MTQIVTYSKNNKNKIPDFLEKSGIWNIIDILISCDKIIRYTQGLVL